jgi:hypothetical protein
VNVPIFAKIWRNLRPCRAKSFAHARDAKKQASGLFRQKKSKVPHRSTTITSPFLGLFPYFLVYSVSTVATGTGGANMGQLLYFIGGDRVISKIRFFFFVSLLPILGLILSKMLKKDSCDYSASIQHSTEGFRRN